MKARFVCLSVSFLLVATQASGTPLAQPDHGTQASILLEGMPSYHQRNVEFDGGGKNYCGPTAASNALMWLADHGYPKLKPVAESGSRAQTEMIKQLAGFMGTYREGTSVASFASGVKTYLQTAGYSCQSWVFSGNSYANQDQTPPDISLIKAMARGNTAMWLSVGWYSFDESCKKYTRRRGHWVTLAGFGKNGLGEDDPTSLLIADPESPDTHKYITLKALVEGRLTDGNVRVPARGYFNIVELDRTMSDGRNTVCVLETIEALAIE